MAEFPFIQGFPDEFKNRIINQWGSIAKFYEIVYDLHASNNNEQQRQKNKKELDAIEDILDEFGVGVWGDDNFGTKGKDIISAISHEHSEIIANRVRQNIDNDLRKDGLDY